MSNSFEDFLLQYLSLPERSRIKFLGDFTMVLTEPQVTTLVRKLEELTEAERRATSQQLSIIIKDEEIRNIIKNISLIRDEGSTKKEDYYNRIRLYTNSAKTLSTSRVNLKKRMIVHVDFAGLGSEYKGNHPAIVWHVENSSDRVLVIPCTSFKLDSTVESAYDINIGPASFFGPNNAINGTLSVSTVVLLDQIQPISRKRITNHLTRNPATGQFAIARIDESQVSRINEGLNVLFYNSKTLYDEYIYKNDLIIPEFVDHDVQYNHLFRIVEVVNSFETHIEYKVTGDEKLYTLYLRNIKDTLSSSTRRNLLLEWIRPKAVRNQDGTIQIPTPTVKGNAYQELLNYKLDQEEISG